MHWNTFDVSGIREIERRIKEYLHPQQFLHVKITENPVDARLNSMLKDEKKPKKTESMHLFERKDFLIIISTAMMINYLQQRN